jgi:hypothetical protein
MRVHQGLASCNAVRGFSGATRVKAPVEAFTLLPGLRQSLTFNGTLKKIIWPRMDTDKHGSMAPERPSLLSLWIVRSRPLSFIYPVGIEGNVTLNLYNSWKWILV